MIESENGVKFDNWEIVDGNHITLDSPLMAFAAGHLEVYMEDPENAFEGNGVSIRMPLPEAITRAIDDCEKRGEKMYVDVPFRGTKHRLVLAHSLDDGRWPWQLIKE
jgi:hypothetical protein